MTIGLFENRRDFMSKIVETRKEHCKYGNENTYIKIYGFFGWSYSSKQLLNRFGNPMPIDERISESDMREKCSYELTFTREVEKETADELNKLQNEYLSIKEFQSCFSGKRVTGCVFLTIAVLFFSSFAVGFYFSDNSLWSLYIIFAFLAFCGLIAVIIPGVFVAMKNGETNDKNKIRKKQIKEKAAEILSKEKTIENEHLS